MAQTLADFLEALGVAGGKQVILNKRSNQKEAFLNKLVSDRESQGETIYEGSRSQQMTRGMKGEKPKSLLDYWTHDQTKTHDLDDQRDGYRLVGEKGGIEEPNSKTGEQKQFEKTLDAMHVIDRMAKELEDLQVPELDVDGKEVKGNPPKTESLFREEEIVAELYGPLLRSGLIPETLVPNKYSQTKKMLDGSFSAYKQRLDKELTKTKFQENFALGKTIFTSTLTVVGGGLEIDASSTESGQDLASSIKPQDNIDTLQKHLGIIPKEGEGPDAEFATDLAKTAQSMDFINAGISFLDEDVYEAGDEIRDELVEFKTEYDTSEQQRIRKAPRLARALVAATASPLGAALNDAGLAIAGSSTFGAIVKVGALARHMMGEEFEDEQVEKMVHELQAAARETLTKLEIPGADKAYKLTIDGHAVIEAFEKGTLEAAIEIFSKAATQAANAAITPDITKLFVEKGGVDSDTQKDKKKRALEGASKAMDKAFDEPDETDDQIPKPKHKENTDHTEPDWVLQGDEWYCAKCAAEGDDARIFAGIIDKKIATLKRDAAILNWSAKLGAMAFEVAATVIAPLAIGGAALKMAKNITLAVKRGSDFVAFSDKRRGMFNAASAFSAPVTRFISNSETQATHYTLNAAAEGAKMIGAILQCSAVAAHVGVGLSAGANIGQAIEAVLYEIAKKLELNTAWKTYQQALDRPENRRMGLIAMQSNSTLAKYAVAWGAVIEKDPLVADFMGACDLNADSLRDPNANVNKVVSYLEARLPDDQVVVGRKFTPVVWAPKTIELTCVSWSGAKALGAAKAKLEPVDTRGIDLGLSRFESSYKTWEDAGTDKQKGIAQKDFDECQNLLKGLLNDFREYRPKKTKEGGGEYHEEMGGVRDQYMDKLDPLVKGLKDWTKV